MPSCHTQDAERARAVYKEALKVIPHAEFSFAKLWVMAAHLEVRAKDVVSSRKVCALYVFMSV